MRSLEEMLPEIRLKVSQADLWGQLAEECVELSQVALKMERTLRGTNPPAMNAIECRAAVLEELADVELMLEVLNYSHTGLLRANMIYKAQRWLKRIASRSNPDSVAESIKSGAGLCPIVRAEDDLK